MLSLQRWKICGALQRCAFLVEPKATKSYTYSTMMSLSASLRKTTSPTHKQLFRPRRLSSTDISSIIKGSSKARDKLTGKTIRIGCASGFWGDTAVAAPQLVDIGNIDFLMFDYLSEITMSLLTASKKKSPDLGYAPDFVHVAVGPLLKEIKKKGIKVLSNAGGVNPLACAKALEKQCEKAGIDMKIAVVTGDDLMNKMPEIINGNMGPDIQSEISPKAKLVNSMNAYLGAGPIAKALDNGADIVVTGRCVDSALALAPLIHSFKWSSEDFDLLAAGSLAGHLIECGAQVTGGIFSGWEMVPDWHNIGFPIVECAADGKFIVTKPSCTGGIVTKGTVAEQLVYEIDDPQNYFLPDVTCDFSKVTLQSVIDDGNNNAILVSNVEGKAPLNTLKVSGTYLDGYRATAVCPVVGPHAVQKAERVAESILERCRQLFYSLGLSDFSRTNVEYIGSEHCYGAHGTNNNTREVVLWIAVQHNSKEALQIFAREIAPAGTGMAPGLTHLIGGRPKVSPVLRLFSYSYPRDKINIDIYMNGQVIENFKEKKIVHDKIGVKKESNTKYGGFQSENMLLRSLRKGSCTFPLGALAYTRSGDKGNNANIGVVCKNPGFYPFISEALTAEAVESYFSHLFESEIGGCKVKRYELPGISALNFVLENSLGGGGIASLRSDPQGKAFGQMLLDFKIKNVPDLLPSTSERLADSYGD